MLAEVALVLLMSVTNVAGAEPAGSTPAGTVKAFYEAANKGDYAAAEKLFTREAVLVIQKGAGSFKAFCDTRTMKRTMTGIQIVREEVRGEEADVRVEASFEQGLVKAVEPLVREGGAWRIIASRPSQIE